MNEANKELKRGDDVSKVTPWVRSRARFEMRTSASHFSATSGISGYFISLTFSLKTIKLPVIVLKVVKLGFRDN